MINELTPTHVKELKQALKDKNNAPHHRKIQGLILYSECRNLTKAANSVGFVHQTVRNLLNRYLSGGLEALLKEKRGGRCRSYMTHEEEENFLKEQLSSALNGDFVTVNSLFEAYQETVGR
ncbi:helix-turn-helix domain-containing protein, partial [Streptococcus castoreus]